MDPRTTILAPENLMIYQLVENFIGSPFYKELISQLQELTGRRVRLLAGVVTRDYNPSRLNILINDQRVVSGFDFG